MDALSCYNAFIQGDEKALEGVVHCYRSSLTAFLCGYVGNVSDAEDLCEDAFVALLEKRRSFQAEGQLKCYLYQTAKHKALNFLKQRRRFGGVEKSEVGDWSELLIREERKRMLYHRLSALEETARQAVFLVYFEDLTYRETARILNLSEKKVDNLLYAAKKKLGEWLKEDLT